ncbi:MAG: hypothetical protein JWQ38_2301, partial [Flavipsychrobacter sp.]|nr:hypothetical protein [Flavipsychrobacter sp.]
KPTPMVSVAETDSALIAKAAALTDVYYYKGNDTVYPSSPASAHNAFFRVRFNMIAKNALTDGGKLPVGGSFPIGALIVKELQLKADGTGLRGFAIMEKSPTDPNAVDGWIWAEYGSTTTPTGISLTGKGSQCVSCHSSSDRDKVRLFSLFP